MKREIKDQVRERVYDLAFDAEVPGQSEGKIK
jgi:hypothetical protein